MPIWNIVLARNIELSSWLRIIYPVFIDRPYDFFKSIMIIPESLSGDISDFFLIRTHFQNLIVIRWVALSDIPA